MRADCFINLGDIAFSEKRLDDAKNYYENAFKERLTEMQPIARAHIGMAKVLIERRKFYDAFGNLDRAYEASRTIGSKKHEAETYMLKGRIYELQNRLNDSLQSYGLAAFLFRGIGNISEMASVERAVGEVYLKLRDGEHAEEHFKKAKELFLYLSPSFDLKDIDEKIRMAQEL